MRVEPMNLDRNSFSTTARGAIVACVLGIAIAAAPSAALAESFGDTMVRGAEVTYDVAILRPLNAVATVLGTGFFLASLPLVAPFEGISTSWDVFVYAPFEYTVLRDIGEF
jgi:hypothetical protein